MNKKKFTNIPLLVEVGEVITDHRVKSNMFNDYFSEQCKMNITDSTLPPLEMRTNSRLQTISINEGKMVKIILSLNSKKANGFDGISIKILKMCAVHVAKPLCLIFTKSLQGTFPDSWKYANIQPVHKKGNREIMSNYRPISLLPICGKFLEKIIFDELYLFLVSNNLISENQSGFRPGDSCINQLLSITSSIFQDFEEYDETRSIF